MASERSIGMLSVLFIVFLVLVGGTLIVLGQRETDLNVPNVRIAALSNDWVQGQVAVDRNLSIRYTDTQATEIYRLLLEGKCASAMQFCGGSDIEKMWVCVDPVTGLVGAIIQFGDEIVTGYFEGRPGYWQRRIARDKWEACDD